MSSEEKPKKNRKFDSELLMKEVGFFVLFALWGAAILLKNQMTLPIKIVVFIVLVLLTIVGLYQLNKNVFIKKGNDNDKL